MCKNKNATTAYVTQQQQQSCRRMRVVISTPECPLSSISSAFSLVSPSLPHALYLPSFNARECFVCTLSLPGVVFKKRTPRGSLRTARARFSTTKLNQFLLRRVRGEWNGFWGIFAAVCCCSSSSSRESDSVGMWG